MHTNTLKVLKVLRYIRMYGFLRTIGKVKSSFHMKESSVFEGNKWINPNAEKSYTNSVAIVGCGNFSFSTISYYVTKYAKSKIKFALDIDKSKSKSLIKSYKGFAATTDFDEIINDKDVHLVFIASNHATHAEYAIKAIEAGKNVQIEKPHAVTLEQLIGIQKAMLANPKVKVFLGFNRPRSHLFNVLQKQINQEKGICSFDWFVAGHEIEDDHWYHSEKEGGRIMGNLCHWSDLSLHLAGIESAFPCIITPADLPKSKSNFSVALSFANGSNSTITFSAKDDPFEGVREILIAHKGSTLAVLRDFYELSMDIGHKKILKKPWHRDHGHKANILNSCNKSLDSNEEGESVDYVYATGLLVLKIKEAVENNSKIICNIEEGK